MAESPHCRDGAEGDGPLHIPSIPIGSHLQTRLLVPIQPFIPNTADPLRVSCAYPSTAPHRGSGFPSGGAGKELKGTAEPQPVSLPGTASPPPTRTPGFPRRRQVRSEERVAGAPGAEPPGEARGAGVPSILVRKPPGGGGGGEGGGEPAAPEGRGCRQPAQRRGCGHMPGLERRRREFPAALSDPLPNRPLRERPRGCDGERRSPPAPLPECAEPRASGPRGEYLGVLVISYA